MSKQKTITRGELSRLAFCNSPKLPKAIATPVMRRMEWVGIGWVDCGEPTGDEVIVIEEPQRQQPQGCRKHAGSPDATCDACLREAFEITYGEVTE